jgi:hypothetical protein
MSLFIKNGSFFNVTANANMDIRECLPVANYTIKLDSKGVYFLEEIESFEITHKLYGDTEKNAKRILNTFSQRPFSTGVMLSGEKGSGKTLLAKKICVDAANLGIPTIIINQSFSGDGFNTFIQSIEQPAIIFFDEFEKVYHEKERQEAVLTLFDGVYPSRKLFICTVNDKYKVDVNMRNRPGRMYYMLDFVGLDSQFVREYCEDNLVYTQYINTICNISSIFGNFNFDMLKAIVEEVNRYNEHPQEVIKMLNTKPEFGSDKNYEVTINLSAETLRKFPKAKGFSPDWTGNPMSRNVHLSFDYEKTEDGVTYPDYSDLIFVTTDIVQIEPSGVFTYENQYGRLILTKKKEKSMAQYAF